MGVIGNFARQNYGAVRFNGGGALALTRGNLAGARPGLWRNAMHRDGQTEAIDLMAMPDGAYPRLAWRLPITAGRISGIGGAAVTVDASATLEKGVPISGTAGIEIAANGTGGLIVSVAGSIALAIDANGTLFASKQVAGSAGIDIDAAGAIWGTGEFSATAGIEIGASATLIGIGTIAGSTEESGLTPQGIAAAVWARIIEAGYSAEEIVRLLAAQAAGSATGLEGSNPQFTGLDGTTVRIDGTYSAGTRTIDALNGA